MAPEIVSKKEYEGPPADVWALGVLLFAMLCGTFPFKGSTDKELYSRINAGNVNIPSHVSPLASALLLRIFVVDASQRITACQILQDPWFSNSEKIVKSPNVHVRSNSYNPEAYEEYFSSTAPIQLGKAEGSHKPQERQERESKPEGGNPMIQTINNNYNIVNYFTEIKVGPAKLQNQRWQRFQVLKRGSLLQIPCVRIRGPNCRSRDVFFLPLILNQARYTD
eukprot:TRINITY_DN1827_c0_g1_i3.p1 TRINITY_DN1827_c0_g1~~TRINITY_DN1827_c0_g1_i3.p1  ORF type:complete len:233 (+),score=8.30 TRINITY_DN1827_c0_g1_i3:33-701(+)